jgi:hypothetical protein
MIGQPLGLEQGQHLAHCLSIRTNTYRQLISKFHNAHLRLKL